MKKYYIILAVIIIAAGVYWFAEDFWQTTETPDIKTLFDAKNATFTIEEKSITLANGVSEISVVPGSASKTITRYFGNEEMGDLNGDGRADAAFLITQETGGSGLFYYAVVALKTNDNEYKTTNAVFIGDRISPQSTYISENPMELQVNYADRKPNEPMSAQPSIGKTLYLKVNSDGVLFGNNALCYSKVPSALTR